MRRSDMKLIHLLPASLNFRWNKDGYKIERGFKMASITLHDILPSYAVLVGVKMKIINNRRTLSVHKQWMISYSGFYYKNTTYGIYLSSIRKNFINAVSPVVMRKLYNISADEKWFIFNSISHGSGRQRVLWEPSTRLWCRRPSGRNEWMITASSDG